MSQIKYGQLSSWDEADIAQPKDFMDLKEGDNLVRVFTNPYQFFIAWIKDASGVNRKLKSAIENCPLVKAGHDIKPRWYVGVLDRKSGQPKILEVSSQIYLGIKNYHSDPRWGDVTKYDLNIKRAPKGSQPLYSVIAYPPKPLDEQEKSLIRNFKERVNIEKFTQPPTAEEVAEKLAGMSVGNAPVARTTVANQEPKKPAVSEEDFNFDE